jgi:hypothetical protein
MALTFYWRPASTTLDGTDDYTAGDSTATASGAPSITANGLETTDASDWYYFDPTSIASTSVGAAAFVIQFPVAVPGSGYDFGIRFIDAGGTNYLAVRTAGATTGFSFRSANAGATNTTTTSGVTVSSATDIGIVIRWDFPNDLMRIEAYSTDGTPLGTAGEDSAADTSTFQPSGSFATYGFQIGNMSSQTNVCYIKNIFVADDYNEPLEDFLDITSYTQYAPAPDPGGDLLLPQFYQRTNTLLRM